MTSGHPKKIGMFRAIYFSFLLICCPKAFENKEKETNNCFLDEGRQVSQGHSRSCIVRRAFFASFGYMVASALAGFLVGCLLTYFVGHASREAIISIQIFGVSLLLWATLFVRGFEIRSRGGATLAERVDQWIYRILYCIGTAVLVVSATWLGS